jgi:hypothetical protein
MFTAPAAHAWPWQGCEETATPNSAADCYSEMGKTLDACQDKASSAVPFDYQGYDQCYSDYEKRRHILEQRMAQAGINCGAAC